MFPLCWGTMIHQKGVVTKVRVANLTSESPVLKHQSQ